MNRNDKKTKGLVFKWQFRLPSQESLSVAAVSFYCSMDEDKPSANDIWIEMVWGEVEVETIIGISGGSVIKIAEPALNFTLAKATVIGPWDWDGGPFLRVVLTHISAHSAEELARELLKAVLAATFEVKNEDVLLSQPD